MWPRSALALLLGPSPAIWRRSVLGVALALTACTPAASAPPSGDEAMAGLPLSSRGICAAMLALPDTQAAERAFTNLAHDRLHDLAADPRLSRAMSGRILETMGVVETDFGRSPAAATLADDLAELHAAAETALRAIGLTAPACVR